METLFSSFKKRELLIDETLEFIVLMVLFYIIYSLSLIIVSINFGIVFPKPGSLQLSYIIFLLIKVAEEEAGYRFMPLVLAIEKWGNSKKVWLMALIMAILFGFRHGHYLLILHQGVFGVLLSTIFLKCGGFNKKYLRAYVSCTTAHALMDCSIRYGFIEILRKLFFHIFVYLANIIT